VSRGGLAESTIIGELEMEHHVLGHEAAGTVDAVGPDVTDVAQGDFVILNWRAVCGNWRACLRGRPWHCFTRMQAGEVLRSVVAMPPHETAPQRTLRALAGIPAHGAELRPDS
jgi:threonine dehydrogenase-like Zn-dependent dehydrogenase